MGPPLKQSGAKALPLSGLTLSRVKNRVPELVNAVVREGALAPWGMANFSDHFSREESEAIRAYVIQQAWRGAELRKAAE